jgi:acyl-coenzyme A synthetase/AMP-(fatty) acid ligase
VTTFEIFSRYTGTTDEHGQPWAPYEIKRALGGSSKDRILAAAAEHGWRLGHGYQGSAALQHGGAMTLYDPADSAHKIHAEFGARGQVTYLFVTRTDGQASRREPRNRCEIALAELTGDPAEARERATRKYDRGQAATDYQRAVTEVAAELDCDESEVF